MFVRATAQRAAVLLQASQFNRRFGRKKIKKTKSKKTSVSTIANSNVASISQHLLKESLLVYSQGEGLSNVL